MKIYSVSDPLFSEYGRIVENFDTTELMKVLARKECPAKGIIYQPTDSELEMLPVAEKIQKVLFGTLPVQIGYTNGHNCKLNALEYHRSSEFNVAQQDIILLLARRQDLAEDFTMDTKKVKAFRIPAGVMVEIYATTLHYAPCQTSQDGYRCIVILPRGTNYPQPGNIDMEKENMLMTAANKWLIAHPEGDCGKDVFIGLYGDNLEV